MDECGNSAPAHAHCYWRSESPNLLVTFTANDAIDLDLYPGGNPCAAWRERRRQIDAGQNHLWPDPTERRRTMLAGRKRSCSQARRRRGELGIGMVFQHFSLFENLTVAENVALGLAADEPFVENQERGSPMYRTRYGLPLDPEREVWRLSVGERQRIEIVRTLMQDPEAAHSRRADGGADAAGSRPALSSVLERLKGEGRAILYISHKLDEVKRALRHRDHSARRQEGRDLQSAGRNGGFARPHDGRSDIGEVKAAPAHATRHSAADRATNLQLDAGRSAWRPAEGYFA